MLTRGIPTAAISRATSSVMRQPLVASTARKPCSHGVPGQIEEIGTNQRLSTGHDKDGLCYLRDAIDQRAAFVGGQFVGVGLGTRACAAVYARQVTRLCHFPGYESQIEMSHVFSLG